MSTPFFGKKTPEPTPSHALDNSSSLRQGAGSIASGYGGNTTLPSSSAPAGAVLPSGGLMGNRSLHAESAAAAASQAASAGGGSKLTVGPNIKLKGVEITDCDTLVVEGLVEATMDSRVMQIAEQGAFRGAAEIDIAEIRGEFSGSLTVREKLVIYATGKVTGTIRYGKLVIEEGGQLSGEVHFGMAAPEDSSKTTSKSGSTSAAKTAGNNNSGNSGNNGNNGNNGNSGNASNSSAASSSQQANQALATAA